MRQLASVQVVKQVEPIDGADAIEKVRVLGWWVVTRRGDYRPGDLVVYCEIDALLPERPEFEFLRPSCYRGARVDADGAASMPAGFRIKTARLRGQVSQGLCLPTSVLPAGVEAAEGVDVAEALGVVKWEPPPPVGTSGRVKGTFPGFLPKTDEARVQVLEGVLERHRGRTLYATEKLDGTSFSAFIRGDEYGICSRNLWMDHLDESNALARVARSIGLEEKLRAERDRLGFDLAIQAEAIGPGIQGNKYALKAVELRGFNVLDVGRYRLVDRDLAGKILGAVGVEPVPDLGPVVLDHSVDDLVRFAEGASRLNPKVQREGVVLRPGVEEHDPDLGGRLSFKVINPRFLLKYDD